MSVGVFEGPGLKGRVLPGGSDWIVVRRDGVLIQDVRVVLQTDDGHNVLMSYRGMRHGPELVIERVDNGEDPDPSEYYFRTTPSSRHRKGNTPGSTSYWRSPWAGDSLPA